MSLPIHTITDAIDFLYSLQYNRWKLDLSRIFAFLESLGNPQNNYRSIHIAGTNGKGSTAAMIENMLRLAGYKTGLYTSPHLVRVSERIRVAGIAIADDDLTRLTRQLKSLIDDLDCTFFEAVTGIALQFFAEKGIDVAIIETGMGGRLDATNVLTPLMSVITSIDYDHCEYLGDTLEKIALEKAGIIKPDGICLSASQFANVTLVLETVCRERNARFYRSEELLPIADYRYLNGKMSAVFNSGNGVPLQAFLRLLGAHQVKNATTALAAAQLLNDRGINVPVEKQLSGLDSVYWPGRFDIVCRNPKIVLDVAHNYSGIATLVQTLQMVFPQKSAHFIVGALKDKPYEAMMRLLAPIANTFVAVTPDSSRALAAEDLAEVIKKELIQPVRIADSVHQAFAIVKESCAPDDLICVTGSHYTVGKVYELLETASLL